MSSHTSAILRSPGGAQLRSHAGARLSIPASFSYFSMCVAKYPLQGFGTFKSTDTLSGSIPTTSQYLTWPQNQCWPAVYNSMTEVWTEITGTQTIKSTYTPFADLQYTSTSSVYLQTTTTTGTIYGGTITGVTVTDAVITITYAAPFGTATYTATLSGSLISPSGAGPFNPKTEWGDLTALCLNLLALHPIDTYVNGYGGPQTGWTILAPESVSPYYQYSLNPYPSSPYIFCFETLAACVGIPEFSYDLGAAWPFGAIADFGYGENLGAADHPNSGWCVCAKSTWQLNGLTWNTNGSSESVPLIAGVANDHTNLYAQEFLPTNFAAVLAPFAAATFACPFPWGSVITFNASDVTANIGSGKCGMLGFQPIPDTYPTADSTKITADSSITADTV